MFCSKCGTENPEGAKFCSKCGNRLGAAVTPTEGATEPEAESSTGLSANVAGLLCYVAGWITGIVFIVLEKKSVFVKFHAWQSIMTFGVLTVAYLILAWIPFIGPFLSLLAPLPFLYYASKLGIYQGLKLAALATLTIGLFARLIGSPQIIIFSIEFSLLGLVLSELFKRRFSLGQTIFFGTAFMLLLGFGFLFFLALSKGMGPFEMTFNYLEAQLKATLRVYEEMGMSVENSGELGAYGKAFVAVILKIYPSLMIIGTGFAVWLMPLTLQFF